MPLLQKPKYPVIDPDPTMERAVMNFSVFDVATIAGFTIAGYVTGHIGSRKLLRSHQTKLLAGLGFLGGSMYSLLASTQRLAGLEENTREVIRYGALTPEQVANHPAQRGDNWKLVGVRK